MTQCATTAVTIQLSAKDYIDNLFFKDQTTKEDVREEVCQLIYEYMNEEDHSNSKTAVAVDVAVESTTAVGATSKSMQHGEKQKLPPAKEIARFWLVLKENPTIRYRLDIHSLNMEICPLRGSAIPSYAWFFDRNQNTWKYTHTRKTEEELPAIVSVNPPSVQRLRTICQTMSGARRDQPFEIYEHYTFFVPSPLLQVLNEDTLKTRYTIEVEALFCLDKLFPQSSVEQCMNECKQNGSGLDFCEGENEDDGCPKILALFDYDSRWSQPIPNHSRGHGKRSQKSQKKKTNNRVSKK